MEYKTVNLPNGLERLYFLVEDMEEIFHLGYLLSTGEAFG
jgi:hypothetical protein